MTDAPKILIVDDDEDDFTLVRDMLCDAFGTGFEPDWAEDYEGGLAAIEAADYDVYLVDYRLGPRDGLDLVREAMQRGCKSPIIFLTGQNNLQTDLDAMAAGAVDYLVKGEITVAILERSIRYAVERKRVELRLERLGFEDGLTGLSNRTLFENRLRQTTELARQEGRSFAVAVMDLDGFKAINDVHGHAAGDAALVEVARRARAVLHSTDTVARIGGDEFVALLPTTSTVEAGVVVAQRLVDIVRQPIALELGQLRLGLSVGIAFYPADGEEPDVVLRRADEAMYRAKKDRSGFAIAGDGDRAKSIDGAILVNRLDDAIARDELQIYYQPKIDLRSGAVAGVEALARWHDPRRGSLSPDVFVAAAEKMSAIDHMTIAILSKALSHAVEFRRAGHDLTLAINLSAQAFRNERLPKLIGSTLTKSGFPPGKLILEISEPSLVSDFDRSVAMLKRIASFGISISIDDFGAGFSALGRLKELPVAEIKIDGSLVRNLAADNADLAIVRSVISLCDDLGLTTVAEAVETPAVLECLKALGCDMAQGYFLAHPMPAEMVCGWFESWSMPNAICRAASR